MDGSLRTFEGTFTVRNTEANRFGQARLETLFDYFQELAGIHADKLGCGCGVLLEHQKTWFLMRARMEVFRTPRLGDNLVLKTWPSGFKRLYAIREGLFYDDCGEIARLTSYWVLLDLVRMRPLRVQESLDVALPDNSDLPHYYDLDSKLTVDVHDNPFHMTVPEHFIDINGHTNNARYVSLVGDWLAINSGKPQEITGITVHFLHETPVWSDIVISGKQEGDGHFSIDIVKDGDEPVTVFTAEGTFRK